jgi:hypothetical protein
MLVERGLRVMNVGVVSDAYAIAANYLCRTGAISDTFATDERLLAIIIKLFERGEYNKARQQGDRSVRGAGRRLKVNPHRLNQNTRNSWKPPSIVS